MGMIGYYYKTDEDTLQKIQEGSVGSIVFSEEREQNLLDMDKTWHAIHFILTGCAYDVDEEIVLSSLVLGGTPVGEDMGYGPVRLITKEEVVQLVEALKEWDEKAFRENFNVEDMIANKIYPVMDNEDEEDFFTYVWGYFVELKEFFLEAAEEGLNILAFIA